MSSKVTELSIDQKLEYLVSRYIKSCVSITNMNKYPLSLWRVIADFIGHCLFPAWDTQYIGGFHELDGRCISMPEIDNIKWSSSFGTIIASHGWYTWRFKIIEIPPDNRFHVALGIWKIKPDKQPPTNTSFTLISKNRILVITVMDMVMHIY